MLRALSTSCAQHLIVALLLAASCCACASSSPGIGIRAARARVVAFEATQGVKDRWPDVTSMDDAVAALKSDRIDAFPLAVRWLQQRHDVEALALLAQIELAWGDAELIVAEVRARTRGDDDDGDEDHTGEVVPDPSSRMLDAEAELDEALRMLGAEHVAAGLRDAQRVLEKVPDAYLGHRVAADAFRMRGNWKAFDDSVRQIEAIRPESNGLVFLRGCRVWMRDGDAATASTHFRAALARDPAFVRAQAWLVLVARDEATRRDALAALTRLSPDHQLVRYLTPSPSPGDP